MGKDAVLQESPRLIVSDNVLDAVRCVPGVESVRLMVTLPALVAVGVPLIVPVMGSIVSPAGRPVAENVYGVVPPLAATGAL